MKKKEHKYKLNDSLAFKAKLIEYVKYFSCFCVLDHNSTNGPFDYIVAFKKKKELRYNKNPFELLREFTQKNKQEWMFGYLSYDLKNDIELLSSDNVDFHQFPKLHFFIPELIFKIKGDILYVLSDLEYSKSDVAKIVDIIHTVIIKKSTTQSIKVKSRVSKDEYIKIINSIKDHLQQGDVYEMNYCQEFYSENTKIDPFSLFTQLNSLAKAPFSAFYRLNDNFCLCSSPERFLKKYGDKIISQPIKGTIQRDSDLGLDTINKEILLNSEKDFSENIMIVDLVRNDLSRFARKSTVHVEELMGLYGFRHVYHLISTISCRIDNQYDLIDALQMSFPMGSMTGAPKIRAMELIEKYEKTLRGIYSGSIGYIDPEQNCDFNVVIRSILYNQSSNYLSFMVGGAITIESDPEMEYNECLMKAKSMFKVLGL